MADLTIPALRLAPIPHEALAPTLLAHVDEARLIIAVRQDLTIIHSLLAGEIGRACPSMAFITICMSVSVPNSVDIRVEHVLVCPWHVSDLAMATEGLAPISHDAFAPTFLVHVDETPLTILTRPSLAIVKGFLGCEL